MKLDSKCTSHVCTEPNFETLFTWEIGKNVEGRRWFYKKLKRLISDIPDGGCKKIGASVYLVKEKYARKFEELLSDFDGRGFTWQKFGLKKRKS